MKKSLFFAAALLSLAACTREMDVKTPVGEMTITAKTETSADTRTVVEGQTHVYWEPGDEIAVFSGGKSGKFTTDIATSSATAEFKGTLGQDAWTEGMDLWAVYPYSKDATFDGETITTTLPSEQIARFGSFGKDMNLSIAHSANNNLQFYNVGGGIRFRLTQEGIKRVTFEGYGGEFLAGKVKIGLDENGLPQIREVTDGSKVITLLPPSGNDSFPTNVWFYCVAIPGSLASGYKLEFYRESEYSRMASEKAVTIKRSIFGSIDNADEVCVFIPIPNSIPIPEAVDLGLSVKWASFNIGASSPEGYGDYYAWGEIEPYYTSLDPLTWKDGKEAGYTWTSYKWCLGPVYTLTKYCWNSSYGYNGFTDNKTVLDAEDDAAHVNLGGQWRMPTDAEWTELRAKCTWTWTTQNGVTGYLVTGPNGNSIYLPAAGSWYSTFLNDAGIGGYYWSSSLTTYDTYSALSVDFGSGAVDEYYMNRSDGRSVRPVYDEGAIVPPAPETPVPDPVDLGLPSGLKWASFNLGASKPEECGDYYAWGETETYYELGYAQSENPAWKPGKEEYGYYWPNYKWSTDWPELTKYVVNPLFPNTDDKLILDPEDDAAYKALGGKWQTPTMPAIAELIDKGIWEWTSLNGVYGCKVTGPNGNSIFLPAADHRTDTEPPYIGDGGLYWSSSLARYGDQFSAWALHFYESDKVSAGKVEKFKDKWPRDDGLSIRPVYGEIIPVESISLDKTELEIQIDEKAPLTATVLPMNATFKSVTWSSSDDYVAQVSSTGIVSGLDEGTAIITATTLDGELRATCMVTVKGR